jgi:hypothetical protein
MIRFFPVVVIGSRSLAYQGAADAASQACEGLPLRTLALPPPLPWNDLVGSPSLDPPQVGYARTVSQLDLVHHVDHQHQRPLENTGAV